MSTKFDGTRLQELLEVLAGARAGDRSKAAVRIEDFTEILKLPEMQTDTIAAAPTMDQFNSLVRDVRATNAALNALALAIQKRQIR
jgi:hypothetical protein